MIAGRRRALPLLALALLASCDAVERMEKLHDRGGPPPVPPELLASADTSMQWVGAPRASREQRAAIGVLVLWNAFDPRCRAMIPMVEAWHEAYARYGLRVTGLHFAPYAFAADSAVVGAEVRRLGVRFANAVVSAAPPPALTVGRGPVVIWPGGGDPAPQWLSTPGDASAFEARLRAKLRQLHPTAGFPGDGGGGVARGEAPSAAARTLRLGTDWTGKGPIRGATPDRPQPFVATFRFQEEGALDTPVPVGLWTPRRDAIEAARGGAANFLASRYDAGPIGVVMAPPEGGPSRVWVLVDERWPEPAAAGADVQRDARGAAYVEVDATRLYEISRGGAHVLKLSPDAPGVRFYAITMEAAATRP